MQQRSWAFAVLAVLAVPAAAQDSAPQGLSGKAALGYLATSGNTESTNGSAALEVLYQLPNWGHSFELSAVSASTGEQTTAEAYGAAYEARRSFGEHNYVFTALDWQRDRFSGYAEQMSETVGYGRRIIDRERHVLDGGIGVGARQTELREGIEERDAIVRGSVDYVWTISTTTEFDQSLVIESGSTNTSLESVSALRARLFGDVALVLSYRLRHNSAVPPGAVNADRFSSIALEYAF